MSVRSKMVLLVFVTILLVLPMLIKGPNGRPIMTVSDWIPDFGIQASNGGLKVSSGAGGIQIASKDKPGSLLPAGKMYKWKDEKGRWHYSNEKPVTQMEVIVDDMPQAENVIEAPVANGANSSTIRLPGGLL